MSTEAPTTSSTSADVGFAVGLGGAVGAGLRWVVTEAIDGWIGLLVVNLAGTALAAAVLAGAVGVVASPSRQRAFVVTGVAGGLTTASTVLVDLAEDPDVAAYATLPVMLAATIGLALVIRRSVDRRSA